MTPLEVYNILKENGSAKDSVRKEYGLSFCSYSSEINVDLIRRNVAWVRTTVNFPGVGFIFIIVEDDTVISDFVVVEYDKASNSYNSRATFSDLQEAITYSRLIHS